MLTLESLNVNVVQQSRTGYTNMTFRTGVAILTGMKIHGYTSQTPVWRGMGLSSSTLSNYIDGRHKPSLFMMVCLADFFKVPLSTFVLWGESEVDIEQLKGEVLAWHKSADQKLSGKK